MIRTLVLAAAIGAAAALSPTDAAAQKVVIVKMVDKSPTEYVFSPAMVTVKPGDVVRFVQTATTPHNVDFKQDIGEGKTGEYLTTPNQTYDVKIDGRFKPGTYDFVCVPHEAMGMIGRITVTAGGN